MDTVFALRVRRADDEAVRRLAQKTRRTRAGVWRWALDELLARELGEVSPAVHPAPGVVAEQREAVNERA
jgi:hypothetical protein